MADISFTVNPVEVNPRSPFVVLRGDRIGVSSIYLNGEAQGTRFPTANTWERDVRLSPGTNSLELYGEGAGNITDTLIVEVEVADTDETITSVFNAFDEWGLLLNLPRLPGEKNQYYQKRLLHTESALGGTNYPLLIQALRRELSFNQTDDALTITSFFPTTTDTPASSNSYVWLEATRICFESDQLRKDNETILIDPGSREAVLSEELLEDRSLVLVNRGGETVPRSSVEVLEDRRTIRVHGSSIELRATYKYLEGLSWADYSTLGDLETAIEAITGVDGVQLFEAEVSSASLATKGLIRIERTFLDPEENITLDHTDFRIIELVDRLYRESLLDEEGYYFNTKLETLAQTLRSRSRIFARDMILDKDKAIELSVPRKFAVLSHRMDPRIAYYTDSSGNKFGFKDFKAGISGLSLEKSPHLPSDLQSGTGTDQIAFDVIEET